MAKVPVIDEDRRQRYEKFVVGLKSTENADGVVLIALHGIMNDDIGTYVTINVSIGTNAMLPALFRGIATAIENDLKGHAAGTH